MRRKKKQKFVRTEVASLASAQADSSDVLEPVPVEQKPSDVAEPDNESLAVDNADFAIKRGGEKFYDYYTTYKNLRDLARPMHGKQASAPIPQPISIKNITIDYELSGQPRSVTIPEPQKIGEIAPLLTFGIRDIIERMNNELHVLSYLVSGMHTAVQAAFNSRAMAPPKNMEDNTNTAQ